MKVPKGRVYVSSCSQYQLQSALADLIMPYLHVGLTEPGWLEDQT